MAKSSLANIWPVALAAGLFGCSSKGPSSAGAALAATAAVSADAWTSVTPAGVSLDPNYPSGGKNFGVQDVLLDPARPSDLYAFISYQGVWRSTGFGQTWSKISTGTNGSALDGGIPWTAAIWPDRNRDAATPPTLWTVNAYGPQLGLFKSTDGGVNWTHIAMPPFADGYVNGQDPYCLDVDPYDGNHLIAGFNGTAELAESTDGGSTWRIVPTPVGVGTSLYVFFVDTGDPATTRTTWLTQAHWNRNAEGMWRTADAGATWAHVQPALEHMHGSSQIYQAGNGVIYAASVTPSGVFRSNDFGRAWTQVSFVLANAVYATATTLYSSSGWASQGSLSPSLMTAPAPSGTPWSPAAAPLAMSNGAKRVAVTFDGSRHILVSGNWLAGLWRYVEPGSTPPPVAISVSPPAANVQVGNTWLTQAQWNANTEGIWRTADAGASWAHVAPQLEHLHGASQIHQAGNGVVFAPSVNPNGVFRSADYGRTWTQVSTTLVNGVYGTPSTVYASNGWASLGAVSPNLISAPAPAGTPWSPMTAPAGMTNGAKRAAVTYDGSHSVIVSGNWTAGLWRFVEGGSSSGGVSITVAPATASLGVGASLQLTARGTGSTNTSVSWSVQEGSSCGTVSASGS